MDNGGKHGVRPSWWLRAWLGGGAVAVIGMVVALITSQVSAAPACAAEVTGTATHYVLDGLGNCGYPQPPALYVALSPDEYDGAAACGSYVRVSGPDGSVTAEVVDQCPPCQTGHVDLSEAAFSEIAPLAAGQVSVSYQTIVDPALPGPIQVEVKPGSSQYWLALLIVNTGNALASVRIGNTSLTRASYNYWIASSGLGTGPFAVQATDTQGHEVTLGDIQLKPGVTQSTNTYMYGSGAVAQAAQATQAVEKPVVRTPSPSPRPRAIMPSGVAAASGVIAGAERAAGLTPSAGPTCR